MTAGLLINGCGGDGDENLNIGQSRAYLKQAANCDDLLDMLKADALAKMNARINQKMTWILYEDEQNANSGWGWNWGYGSSADDAYMASEPESRSSDGNSKQSSQPPSEDSGGNNSGDSDRDYSRTNTQHDDVDEADIVKTDGTYIYLLHGQEFLVLTAWPAVELAQYSSLGIEGNPIEMYVTDTGKVVVYSTVNGAPVYSAAGLSPRDTYSDWGNSYDSNSGPSDAKYGYPENSLTKVTVLELDNAQPSVTSELYFEGRYTSSRRVGQFVRTVLEGASFGPKMNYYVAYHGDVQSAMEAYEKLRAENVQILADSTLADWLPYYMVRSDSGVDAYLSSCEGFHVPTAGTTEYGMTQIQAIDLDSPNSLPYGISVVGSADTVYSSVDMMVLATRGWIDQSALNYATRGDSGGNSGQISTSYTHLHAFDLAADPARPMYTASGSVAGTVHNQFSIDEYNNHLRVATTDDRLIYNYYWQTESANNVFVLHAEQGELVEAGSVRDLAPTERIYSARFLGNRGYLVTFRQVDPLFVIDLSNPAKPVVLGELKIPGFSEYMHPLGENHLLTIGRDGGLALQIFDVTDPVHPVQKHKYQFSSSSYGYSEAESNHKAFTYYASRGLLAFPYVGHTNWNYSSRSSLELFDIDTDKGISPRGSIDHTDLLSKAKSSGYCNGYYGVEVRRGVFIDDYVYSVSYGGIKVNHIDDLDELITSVDLEVPKSQYYGCY